MLKTLLTVFISFLTTANTFDQDDTEGDSMTRHFTLLFLDEKENIEREIEKEIDKEIMAEPTNANSNLLYFVQHCKPTLSCAPLLKHIDALRLPN